MTDIIERIRLHWPDMTFELAEEAADEIERLREELRRWHEADSKAVQAVLADNERLRAALEGIASENQNPAGSGPAYSIVGQLVRKARAALVGDA